MKKIIAFVLMLSLVCCMAFAHAAELILPEKMKKQLEIGSGLKGSFTISTEGFDPEIPVFRAVKDVELQLRGLSSANELHYYIYQADEKENQNAKTELYGTDSQFFFRSDCLPDTVLTVPNLLQVLNQIPHTSEGNPSFFSVVYQLAIQMNGQKKKEWDPVLKRYQDRIELWLARFPVETDYVPGENDRSLLNMSYAIPYSSMQSFLFELLPVMLQDGELMELLGLVMDEEQKDLYLNQNLLYFYQQAMDAAFVDDDIVLIKENDAKTGRTVSQHLSLPLNQKATGFELLQIDDQTENSLITYTLKGEDRTIQVSLPSDLSLQDSFDHEILFRDYCTDAGKDLSGNKSWRIHLSSQVSAATISPEDEKTHENYEYTCEITQDLNDLPEDIPVDIFPEFEPVTLHLTAHFSSKNAQQSPTTAEIVLDYQKGNEKLHGSGSFKSASPWLLTPFDHSSAVSLLAADEKQRDTWLNEWAKNAEAILQRSPETAPETTVSPESEKTDETAPDAETEKTEAAEPETNGNKEETGSEEADAEPEKTETESENGETEPEKDDERIPRGAETEEGDESIPQGAETEEDEEPIPQGAETEEDDEAGVEI